MGGHPAIEALFETGERRKTVEGLEEGEADQKVEDLADGLCAAVVSSVREEGPDALFALANAEAVALGQAFDLEWEAGQSSAPVQALDEFGDGGAEVAATVKDDERFAGMALALLWHGFLRPVNGCQPGSWPGVA